MSHKVEEALGKRFKDHRIVFWYDGKKEFSEVYDQLSITGVKKIKFNNNEFELKYLIYKSKPSQKFLIYVEHSKPPNEQNWLLDVELAHHVFQTDQEAIFLQEIGLPLHFKELVTEHIEFFKAKERRIKLKELLNKEDQHEDVRGKMLAVLFNTDYVNMISFIHSHGSAYIDGNNRFDKDLERFNLKTYYWGKIKYQFGYESPKPSIYDFLIEVFNANFTFGRNTNINKESRLILSLWKDTIQYREGFGKVSKRIEKDLEVIDKLNDVSLEEIIDDDLFKSSDLKIIHGLTMLLAEEQISHLQLIKFIKQRENKFWFKHTSELYNAIAYGSEMISLIRKFKCDRNIQFKEAIEAYAENLFEIDQAYRKFIYYLRQTGQNKILHTLAEKTEKVYSNDWLLEFNNNWQTTVDSLSEWPNSESYSQNNFFNQHVKPFTAKKNRLFVIISDALRYESGAELSKRLLSENRYESSLEYMVTNIPSYTQLGMASLLPHEVIEFKDKSDGIIVDGISASGTENRSKILDKNSGVRATAIKAEDFMNMNTSTEGRSFAKKYDLIYIYHNSIDKTGDDKLSESKVFEAVENELEFLTGLMKKIANVNGNHMMITSDHGFLYQHNPLDESDFSTSDHSGDIWKENRRFVIGNNLKSDKTTKKFTANKLNIKSDADVLIPKSINRLRVKGAGSRFIHGGTAIQEIVVPLLKVSKKRSDTTSQVDIDIIKSTDRITTNILAVSFIQQDLVTDQMLPRKIKSYIIASDNTILSDQFSFNFNIKEGSERQREVKHRFQLLAKASGKYKNQRVKLILEEPIEGTQKWKEYKAYSYTLNISFTNDFDDF